MNGPEALAADTVLRIAKWDEVFERSDTRKVKSLTWVALPIGFTSHGYQSMLDEFGDEAAAVYGCWVALVSFAASCTVRGTLATSRGSPTPMSHLSRVTGFDEKTFARLIDWALRPEIGWLERVPTTLSTDTPPKTAENAEKSGNPDAVPPCREIVPTCRETFPTTGPDRTRQDQTEHDMTTTGQDQTEVGRSVGQSSVVMGFGWDDLVRLGKKFRRVSGVSESEVDTELLSVVLGLDLSADRGFASDIAENLRSNRVRKPRKYVMSAIRRRCEELGVDQAELEVAIKRRIAEIRPVQRERDETKVDGETRAVRA